MAVHFNVSDLICHVASVSNTDIDGVEASLDTTLHPIISKEYPMAIPIPVNLPLNFG